MKRCLVPLTSLFLVFALAACGSSGGQSATQAPAKEAEASAQATDDSKADDSKATDESAEPAPKDDKESAIDPNSKTTDDSTDNSTDETQPAEEEKAFERGTIDGDTYRSELFGITYTLPEDYQFATDEQLAQMANVTTDILEDEASQKALENGRVLFDMYAFAPDGQNLSLTIEKGNAMTGVLVSVEQYRDVCISKLDEQLAGTGMEIIEHEDITYQIGDTDYPGEDVVLTYQGSTIYERIVFLKSGSYFGLLTATSPSIEEADQLLSHCAEI